MENELSIIGDSGKRKSRYNPNLAEQFIKDEAEKERRALLEEKLKKSKEKNKPSPPAEPAPEPVSATTPPSPPSPSSIKLPILATILNLGTIVESNTDFYNELIQLESSNARLISPRDEAYARITTSGKENLGKSNGTWARAGFEYLKGELPLIRLESRLLDKDLAKQAVEENRQSRYFSTNSKKEYQESRKIAEKELSLAPEQRTIFILPERDNFQIDKKKNYELLEFLLKDQASPYFKFIKKAPITVYLIDKNTIDNSTGTILTALWFYGLGYRSDFGGLDRVLGYNYRARGVCSAAGAATQNFSGGK